MTDTSDIQVQGSAGEAAAPTPKVQVLTSGASMQESSLAKVKEKVQHGPAIFQIMRLNRQAAEDGMLLVHPEKYLEASFEVFLFMLAVCWTITAMCAAPRDQLISLPTWLTPMDPAS